MRSSCAFSVILVLAIGALIVQGRKQDCPCGGLGPEKNPCTCNEVVVKAAKLPKPVAYAPPQVIAQAAELREKLARTTSGIVYAHSSGHQHQGSGCGCGGGGVNVVDNSVGGVNVVDNSVGGVNVVDNSVGGVNVVDNSVGGVNIVGGGKPQGSLQLRDLVKGHQKIIVPSFRPIGDVCYPLPMHPTTGKMIERITTVTPAHPGKPKCSCHNRPIPYEYCVKLINGHIVPPEYPGPQPRHPDHPDQPEYYHGGQPDHHGLPGQSDHLGYHLGHPNSHPGLNPGHHGPQPRTWGGMFEEERIVEEDSEFYRGPGGGMIEEDHSFYRGPGGGMIEEDHSFYRGPGGGFFEEDRTTYGSVDEDAYYGRHVAPKRPPRPILPGGSGMHGSIVDESDCDGGRTEVQVQTPRVPVDPVSLALAFKSIHPPHVIYKGNKKMPFVPEDKLSFGHRTLPTEVKTQEKKKNDIAEEKLIVVDKPVVELKLQPTKNVVIGSYDEKEEAKLAELEAVEREYIAQEEAPVHPTEPQVTYGELGYVPLGTKPSRPKPHHMTNTGLIIENGSKAPCGPLGPRVPGYVPGSVVVQEFVEKEETFGTEDHGFHGRSQTIGLVDEEDSEEEYVGGSDFLSKLRSVSKHHHGSGPCPH